MKLLCVGLFVFVSLFTSVLLAQESKLLIENTSSTLISDSTQKAISDSISPQDSVIYVIGSIQIKGNKKTKSYIVLREVPFRAGDLFSPKHLTEKLELAREQVMNTALFVDVKVYVSNLSSGIATVNIDLKERLYVFPLPYFRLIDRNFNQWWVDQKRDLNRVNYGAKIFVTNVSGRNDKVALDLINGYNQQIGLRYDQPFADKKLKHGFGINLSYSRQREMNYGTEDNKQVFYKNSGFIREYKNATLSYSYRPDTKYRFYVRMSYTAESVNDSILVKNPDYFPKQKTSISYPSITLTTQYFNVDYIPFPQKGFMYEINLSNRGLGNYMNMFSLSVEFTKAFSLAKGTFIQSHNFATVKLPFKQPYYNQGLLGYGDTYLRGLESYVVDGVAGFLNNTTFYQKLFSYVLKNPIRTKSHDRIPFTFYIKAFGDAGYVYNKYNVNESNSLSNKFLYAGGLGIDIVTIYDIIFRLEYSFNQLGKNYPAVRNRGDF